MVEFLPTREVFVSLLGWQVRWYGVLYVAAFWLAWWVLPRIQKYRGLDLSRDEWSYVLMWGVVGVLAGGRLGYVLLYEPGFFLANPMEIVQLWHGGMSAHGGFVGVAVGMWLAARQLCVKGSFDENKTNTWCLHFILRLFDLAVVPVAMGLALGRFGNWINRELFPGNVALAVVGVNVLIAWMCYWLLVRTPSSSPPPAGGLRGRAALPGQVAAMFLILYAVFRFFIEFVRLSEWPTGVGLTRGQLYTLPVLLIGIWLWHKGKKLAKNND